jgi:hypothetical protein
VPSSSGLRSPAMPLIFGFLARSTSLYPCRAGRTTSSTPRPRKAPNLVARKRQFVEQFPADLGHPVSREEIFRFSSDPNQWLFPRCPVSTRGADRASSRTRDGMRWTRQRQARCVFAGRLSVSEHGAQDDRRCSVRQNRVVLTPVAGAKLPVANVVQPDRFSHQAGSDGGKRNSSPGSNCVVS